jgi:hypothetical protein
MTTLLFLLACSGVESVGVLRVSHVGSDWDGTGHAGITMEDGEGRARSWEGTSIDVDVSTRQGGGAWATANDVTWSLDAPGADHLVVVADNSGSVLAYEETIANAVGDLGASVLANGADNAVGLVRVSTESTVLSLLVDDDAAFADAAASGLDISNGWTALYDGVRYSSDVLTLGDQIDDGVNGVCLNQSQHNILVFTDGRENNSQDQHPSSYPGDGIDTTLDDLYDLRVHGTTPAIHSIAVGADADSGTLQQLADYTGGTYREIADYSGLLDSLHEASVDMEEEIPVCFETTSCDHDEALITVTVTESDGAVTVTETVIELPQLCTEGGIPEDDGGCTYTQGYWKNHEESWPVSSLTLGAVNYSASELLTLFGTPVKGDASLSLGHQLMAAKLNVANGADDSDVSLVIENADAWLSTFSGKLPYKVKSGAAADAIVWAVALDDFNNGVSGPGHCD